MDATKLANTQTILIEDMPLLEKTGQKEIVKERPKVSVIIPTLNEAKNLPLVLPFLPMNWIDEVILVDGRSTDNTVEVAKQMLPSIRVILEKRKGKGIAMRTGYEASIGDILIVLDADGSNDPREIPRFITALMQGADFVKGSRFTTGAGTTDMSLIRKLGNFGFVVISNILFGVGFTDLCYGYHAFWKYSLNAINLEKMDGFEIDTAIYLQAVKAKLRIVEVPSFEGYRFYGEGKLQTIPDGFRVLRTIFGEWLGHLRRKDTELYLGFRGSKLDVGGEAPVDTHFLQLLNTFVLSRGDIGVALERLLKVTLDVMKAASGSLVLLTEDGEIAYGIRFFEGEAQAVKNVDFIKDGLAGWVIRNRQPALVADTNDDPRWIKRPWDSTAQNSRSVISLPLMLGNRLVGVLTLARIGGARFVSHDLTTLKDFTLGEMSKMSAAF